MRTFVALLVTAMTALACGASNEPRVASPVEPRAASPEGPPAAGGAHELASGTQRFAYAQRGQSCSPTDGGAVVLTFTRVDRGCAAQTGDEILIVTYWNWTTRGDTVFVTIGKDGQAQTCVKEKGGCEAVRSAELSLPKTGPSHVRAQLADGRVVDDDFVVRECPEQTELCG